MATPTLPGIGEADNQRTEAAVRQIAQQAATFAPIDSPVFTTSAQAPTPATNDNSTNVATTEWVKGQGYGAPVTSLPLSGDVGGTTGANTIGANKVTYPKFQQVAAARLLGNAGASAANVGELTISQVLDLITTTRGSILFRGASGWQALAPGASGQFLKTNGAGADPAFASVPVPAQPIFAYAKGQFAGATSTFSQLVGVGGTITRPSQGNFRLTFTTAQPDTNYLVLATWSNGSTFPGVVVENNRTVNSVDVMLYQNNTNGAQADAAGTGFTTYINIACLR